MDLIAREVQERRKQYNAGFESALPFRHCVIDGFLAPDFAARLLAQFPPFERGDYLNEDGKPGGKSTIERLRGLGDAYRQLDDLVQSPEFLRLIGDITGIPGLLYDPMYFGGGTHENRSGQGLDNHIDFNYHPATLWHRRLNLIVYLNPEWETAWGGSLELHRDPYDPENDETVVVPPLFNRCVIFETTEHSWHGFGKISLPAAKAHLSRKSIALYFYTETRPEAQTARTHSTVYVDRQLPAHLRPGHVLTEQDCTELRELFSSRADHNRRLYAEIERLQADLEMTALGRVVNIIRRRIARFRLRRASAG
ncbi:hypothetical protein GCM10027084_17560 [Pseudoxanthomonas sangjuensis]|uniref:2OG-Fe(II) oxygenase n=1 Tax=Pseudoxanthomonas sangjuensis TaxID=1503750 RepID=UPI0013911B6C|nr:2OG-Fe(II) oxygenase [Pseudoxanthomonas sangjuensis]KAF1713157.1 hypothetical protein CSC71_09225 [Pseudoxanthomonas sangjuensis]